MCVCSVPVDVNVLPIKGKNCIILGLTCSLHIENSLKRADVGMFVDESVEKWAFELRVWLDYIIYKMCCISQHILSYILIIIVLKESSHGWFYY